MSTDGADGGVGSGAEPGDLSARVAALEGQQAGLASPEAVAGPLHPLLEANVAKFAGWYRGRMGL